MTQAQFKDECLQRFRDGGPHGAIYGLAFAVMNLADVVEIGLGTSELSKRNALEDLAAKLQSAAGSIAEAVQRLADVSA